HRVVPVVGSDVRPSRAAASGLMACSSLLFPLAAPKRASCFVTYIECSDNKHSGPNFIGHIHPPPEDTFRQMFDPNAPAPGRSCESPHQAYSIPDGLHPR